MPGLPVGIKLPGAFCNWFEGTNLVIGQDDADPDCKATRLAYQAGRRVGVGSGYYVAIITDEIRVLKMLREYAEYCLEANRDERIPAEVAAARKAIARADKALNLLAPTTTKKD